jgi:hypothetical protein
MGAEDRAWILERLPSLHAELLQGMIEELRELGIPADASLLRDASAAQPPPPPPLVEAPRDPVLAIAEADLETLVLILKEEPPGLVARLLDLHPWPWEEALLARMHPDKLAQVQALRNPAGRGPERGQALRALLLDGLGACLRERGTRCLPPPAKPAGSRPRPWWRRAPARQRP